MAAAGFVRPPGEWFDKDRVIDLGELIDALAKVDGENHSRDMLKAC